MVGGIDCESRLIRAGWVVIIINDGDQKNRKYSQGKAFGGVRIRLDESLIERWGQNVVVGSCLQESRYDYLVGSTVKRQNTGRASWDKVPSCKVQ